MELEELYCPFFVMERINIVRVVHLSAIDYAKVFQMLLYPFALKRPWMSHGYSPQLELPPHIVPITFRHNTGKMIIPKKLNDKQKDLLQQFEATVSGNQYEKKKSFFDRVKDAFT